MISIWERAIPYFLNIRVQVSIIWPDAHSLLTVVLPTHSVRICPLLLTTYTPPTYMPPLPTHYVYALRLLIMYTPL